MQGPCFALENLFVHEGIKGHEYVFCRRVVLASEHYNAQETVQFSDGTPSQAGWYTLKRLADQQLELHPEGVAPVLTPLLDARD